MAALDLRDILAGGEPCASSPLVNTRASRGGGCFSVFFSNLS